MKVLNFMHYENMKTTDVLLEIVGEEIFHSIVLERFILYIFHVPALAEIRFFCKIEKSRRINPRGSESWTSEFHNDNYFFLFHKRRRPKVGQNKNM